MTQYIHCIIVHICLVDNMTVYASQIKITQLWTQVYVIILQNYIFPVQTIEGQNSIFSLFDHVIWLTCGPAGCVLH